MRKAIAIALLGLSGIAGPVLAHHGWAAYDTDKPLTLAGTITEVSYAYPHATIKLVASGQPWSAILAPPSRMATRGLAREDLKVGMQATVEGFPSRHEPGQMRAERITVNGKAYELR